MAIQHFNTIWCRNPGHIVHDIVTHWVPRRRSEKQAKNNEESISERLVQATKEKREKNKNRPTTKKKKNPEKWKERTKQKTATGWMGRRKKEKNKNKPATKREKRRRKKGTVNKWLVQISVLPARHHHDDNGESISFNDKGLSRRLKLEIIFKENMCDP